MMKVIKKHRHDVANETVTVELTIAEVAVLATTIGEFDSKKASDMVYDDYEHTGLADAAREGFLGRELYNQLDKIVVEAITE